MSKSSRTRTGPTVDLINSQRREILALKRNNRDLRWEIRSLKVRLYAHETYATRYEAMHGQREGDAS
jgi:hypothetical protein